MTFSGGPGLRHPHPGVRAENGPAAYLIAVKRTSVFCSVILGGLWLKERPIVPCLVGAALMMAGVMLIA